MKRALVAVGIALAVPCCFDTEGLRGSETADAGGADASPDDASPGPVDASPDASADADADASVALPPVSGLLAYWPFDGDARDVSGNGHDGTVVGAVSFIQGVRKQAAFCGGSGASVAVGDRLRMGTSSFSIVAWVKLAGGHNTNETFIAKGAEWFGAGTTPGYGLGYADGPNNLLGVACDGTACVRLAKNTVDLNDGAFRMVAMTLDHSGGSARLYEDLTEVANGTLSAAFGALDNTAPLTICSYATATGHEVKNGTLDELMVFDHALTALELAQITSFVKGP